MKQSKIKVLFFGRVQGVWFRGFVQKQAEMLGVSGWVRNCSDGSVEALCCGPKEKVDELLKICKDGPPLARVNRVVCEPFLESCDSNDFKILYG